METIDAKVVTGVPDNTMLDIMDQGQALIQSQAGYHTAVAVQKARDLDRVERSVMREAEFAGVHFYYSWKAGGKMIEGGSIGLAVALAREWTNCVINTDIEHTKGHWIFKSSFIDLERGFTITRSFRQAIPHDVPKRKDGSKMGYSLDRYQDMEFQKGQSKAIRNVIFAGVPRWLLSKAIDAAKEAEINNISKEGIDKSRDKAFDFFAKYGVDQKRIIAFFNKPKADFDSEDIAALRNFARQVKDGETNVDYLFPEDSKSPPPTPQEPKKSGKGKGKRSGKKAQQKPPENDIPLNPDGDPGAMPPDETPSKNEPKKGKSGKKDDGKTETQLRDEIAELANELGPRNMAKLLDEFSLNNYFDIAPDVLEEFIAAQKAALKV